jgi:hypothetical protein
MEERRIVHGQVQWTGADRERAYAHWTGSGSLKGTGKALDIPMATVATWCRKDRWVARREAEDELDREMSLQRAFVKIVKNVDPLICNLLEIAGGGTKDDAVRLKATMHALAIVGIAPVARVAVTGRPDPPERRITGLSDADIDAIEAVMGPQEEQGA